MFLEVVPGRKLVSTSAFTESWVPQAGDMNFVRIDTFAQVEFCFELLA